MKGFVALLLGLALIATSAGCCCWNQPCAPYQSCPGGVCPPGGVGYPPAAYGTSAYSPTPVAPIATAPQTYYSNYPTTAFAPLESLPTY